MQLGWIGWMIVLDGAMYEGSFILFDPCGTSVGFSSHATDPVNEPIRLVFTLKKILENILIAYTRRKKLTVHTFNNVISFNFF